MKKLLAGFIVVCLILILFLGGFGTMASAGADITEGYYTYTVDGSSNATITEYTSGNGVVVIPSTLGGCPVTSIGELAFNRLTILTSVTIPASVTRIGDNAFWGCSFLTSVTIGSGVTRIGDGAFQGCSSLPAITIPDSVTSIGNNTFHGCSSLTSVTIPDSVTSIGDNAFYGCTKLITVTIPVDMTSIGKGVFKGCTALTSVTIPAGVTSIGGSAFWGCTALTSVTIPSSVTSIGVYAFDDCPGLTNVTIGSGVTSIGNYAFYNCTGLTSAYFLGNAPTGTTNMFQSCATGFTVHYKSGTTGWSNPWYGYPTTTVENTAKPPIVLVLHVGSSTFVMNGVSKTLDSPPVIKNGRTLVPVRAIIEALRGSVGWYGTARKATVVLGTTTINLWIDKATATVNGKNTPVDATNTKVVPEIINDRTMLPLRFVAENLGCTVIWTSGTQTITITYIVK